MSIRIETGLIDEVVAVSADIPELDRITTREIIEGRFNDARYLILIAKSNDLPVGFKVGYSLSEDTFYSWMGGVVPQYRGQGIASLLLKSQEKWAEESGFTTINVKSMNRYPSMLKLLISNGYQITEMEKLNGKEDKVLFSKKLSEHPL